MHGAQVTGVAAVASTVEARRPLETAHAAPGLHRHDGGAEAGIAAADHQHVEGSSEVLARHCLSLDPFLVDVLRSEERRVGKEGYSTCKYRLLPEVTKKN